MTEVLIELLPAAGFGAFLGAVFFVGLRLTVERLTRTRRPYALLALSFVARTAVVLAGLYWMAAFSWQHVVAAFVGFFIIRMVIVIPSTREAPR